MREKIMITNIELKNFKAFEAFNLQLDEQPILIYGDNGTGKSSIYEAIKLFSFADKLIGKIDFKIEEKNEKITEWLNQTYDNKKVPNFKLIINNETLNIENVQAKLQRNEKISPQRDFDVHLINLYSSNLTTQDFNNGEMTLNLKSLLQREYLSIDLDNLSNSLAQQIINKVNELLNEFQEHIIVKINADFDILIVDNNRNITEDNIYLNLYYNEAKLNLVVLLLLFSSIEILADSSRNKLIVLDDFITSLDIANRTFLLRYILQTFAQNNCQLIILTHNLDFFNLVKYMIDSKNFASSNEWHKLYLYEINNKIEQIVNSPKSSGEIIKKLNQNNNTDTDLESIGNMIRKKFENLIHIISRELIFGSLEKSNEILKSILENQNIYLKEYQYYENNKKKKIFLDATDLVNAIEKEIETNPDVNIDGLSTLINEYKIPKEKLHFIRQTLQELTLYRKVIMHPLSHSESPFAIKEFYKSIHLLKNLEEGIDDILNQNNAEEIT